jgi:transcriptional regulator with XRE-family HTH domain
MKNNTQTDFSIASPEVVAAALGERLEQIRLARNISQADLAEEAGVSRSTVARLARPGQGISLDSFIRIMQALDLAHHLQALLPDPSVRPLDRVKLHAERRRASGRRQRTEPWAWGDQDAPSDADE